ncbi:MAG TPA: arginine deiminase family protein [Thermomicrobiales bacterium]|nr:arginine deiminase family protein [Thermomicrobiales bacterium]
MTAIDESIETSYGGHSLWEPLRRVMVREPGIAASDADWSDLAYLHPVDHQRSLDEHAAFVELLVASGAEVVIAPPDEPGYMDAVFCYDPSLMTDGGAVLLRPGKPQRVDEVAFHAQTYAQIGIPVLGAIEAPGTIEGGDTLWIDDKTLAVGRGYRTNGAGIEQLRKIVGSLGVEVVSYDLAHYHGPGECLHLMSFISPVAEKLAVVYLPLMPVQLVEDLRERGWAFIEVPDEEFETMACNVLALGPRMAVAMDGNPITRARMEAAGCTVQVYPGGEISYNRAGGPTCLSRPLWRKA